MEIERSIRIYNKFNDKFINEINLIPKHFDDVLKLIEPRKNDPLFYECYLLSEAQLKNIQSIIDKTKDYDFEKLEYYLEANQSL